MTVEEFRSDRQSPALLGETEGEGTDVFLCHGLSATRKYVTHGSRSLPRAGYRVHTYDARGHGASDPAPEGEGYGYEFLVQDLDRLVTERAISSQVVVGGHSMGCHTAAAWALAHPDRVAALVLIGPVFGGRLDRPGEDRWDARAEALVRGGPEAFAAEIASGFDDPEIAKTVERLALDRARLHRNPAAVAEALREVPRSAPFLSLDELRSIDVPTLVVGSHDEADPAHPLSTARDWADTIPDSRFVVEEEGDPPLSWQGGRLSRVIAEFLDSWLEPLRDRSEGADAEAVVRSKGREQ